MNLMHASLLGVLAAHLSTAAVAAPLVPEANVELTQLAEEAARKGTRNFRSDSGAAATATDGKTEPNGDFTSAEKLSQCMDTWDKGTHITKSKWREICQRQLNEP